MRRRRLAPVAAAVLWSLAIGIGIAEFAVRLLVEDGYYVWSPGFEVTHHPDPEVVPGISGRAQITINRQGMRGEPFGPDPQYRLLAVGGSTTMCAYLDDARTWTHLVQERLNAVLGPGAAWVGNAGRPGHTSGQHVHQVEKLLDQYPQIDGVLLLIGVNDLLVTLSLLRDASAMAALRAARPTRDDALLRAFAVVPRGSVEAPWYARGAIGHHLWMRRRTVPEGWAGAALREDGSHLDDWREFRRQATRYLDELPNLAPVLRGYTQNLRRIAHAARERNARLVFLTQPTLWRDDLTEAERALLWTGGPPLNRLVSREEYYSVSALAAGMQRYNDALLGVCRQRGVECVDLAARVPRNTRIFYDDAHFTEEGARLVAALVAEHLLSTPPLADSAGRDGAS